MKLAKKYGDWALVTGASSGIGKEIVKQLANEGFNLVLVSRSKSNLSNIKEEINNPDVLIITIELDLTSRGFLIEIVEQIKGLDIGLLANLAGAMTLDKYVNMSLEDELYLIELNIIAPSILTNHFAKVFKKRGKGAILITGSMLGYIGTPYMAIYSATKAYENTRAEALYHELKQYHIDVLGLAPGLTKTPMTIPYDFSALPMKISEPQKVAIKGIRSMGKRPLTTPGVLNKFMNAFSKHVFSRKFNSKMFQFFLKKVYQKKESDA